MGKIKHNEWEGFWEIRENNVITGAKCMKCNKGMIKRDKVALAKHK